MRSSIMDILYCAIKESDIDSKSGKIDITNKKSWIENTYLDSIIVNVR